MNPAKSAHRGGVAVLVKNYLFNSIKNVEKSYENIITFQLSFLPNFIFILCYITPIDSPYYDDAIFGKLHSILVENDGLDVILFGDLNSRVETCVLEDKNKMLSYIN